MSLRYLLDTDTVIAILRQPTPALRTRLAQEADRLAVSAITVSELTYGVEKSSDPARNRAALQMALAQLEALDFDDAAAAHAGEIRALLARAGTPIGGYDVLIAGHARAAGLTVVTHNIREFGRVPGLVVEDWLA